MPDLDASSARQENGHHGLLARAMELLHRTPLIDGHNDFPYILRGLHSGGDNDASLIISEMPIGQTDLTRLEKGRLGGQFWSAFVPCSRDKALDADLVAVRDTLQQIDLIHRLIAQNPRRLAFAHDSASVWEAFRSGRIASLIGVEGLHQIGGSFSALRLLHRLGVRYITLCHDSHNEFVDSSTPAEPLHGGLSKSGEKVIREMNQTGLIIDLSHTSHDTQRCVLQASHAPVIFSHSSCFALKPHPRNVPDDILRSLAANNGVVMICFLPSLSGLATTEPPTPATVATVADHVVHVGERIGYAHVGIGSDFDGMLEGPAGLDDVSAYPALVAELMRRGLSDEILAGILGGNVLRVLDDVARYASVASRRPEAADGRVCDSIDVVWTPEQQKMLTDKGIERRAAAHLG
ncbi:membrane dipeptidase GliJ [Akanthomyces lecanii RCEF 1005]|uniref:Dipeptidase n=1 Tax=Akanthomyces lecanii RCEF 1005 TaxID=1081108 RepID=A0A168GLS4_CORDF|nr:membrane dipeptidase GliJ [Akanthomyces lecanii RCEF 1005]